MSVTVKARMLRSYRKGTKMVFVYGVSGSGAALKRYAEAQGENHRVDEKTGKPLFFTVNAFTIGDREGTLVITDEGKIFPDMSGFHAAASLVEQFGGNLGDKIAENYLGKSPEPGTESEEEEDDDAEG